MPTDEQINPIPPEGEEAPPPPPELPLCWAYLENGAVADRGEATCVIEGNRLNLKCKSGPPFAIAYADIKAIEDRDAVNLLLTMRDGTAFELSKMARLHDMLRSALMEKWTALNRKQALAEETLLDSFTGKAAEGDGKPLPCGIGVYATAVVLDFEDGRVQRIPLIFSGKPEEGDYAFTFTPPGERLVISHLGRETDRFRSAVAQAFNKLEEDAQQRLSGLCPSLPPMKARGLAKLFLDGLAVPLSAVRESYPALERALVKELEGAGLLESWQAASELGDRQCARIGQKAALKSSDGLYRWFFMPVVRGDKAAVIMEASGEGSSGRATYVFRVPGGPGAVDAAMDSLNYGLVMINFRREPIYLSDEQMQKPANAHYLRSVERVPALASLRSDYLGRVAHTSPEAWRRGLEDILNKL